MVVKISERRQSKCQEETEQAREVRDLVQAEAWVEPVAVAAAWVVVQLQALVDTVFARTVVRRRHISWGLPAMSKNVLNVEPL